jgi:hypothetical protein
MIPIIKTLDSNMSLNKKELSMHGADDAKTIIESGDYTAIDMIVKARKVIEYLTGFVKELDSTARTEIINFDDSKTEVLGSKVSLSSTGDRLDFEDDPRYLELKMALDHRKELLTIAHKSKMEVFDEQGAQVPSVPIKTHSRETLNIKI